MEILLSELNNDEFAKYLFQYMVSDYDVILESFEPQSGKTKIILLCLWISQYINKRHNIVILDNRANDLRQIRDRIDKFNKIYSKYPIDPDIVIGHEYYLSKVYEFILNNRNIPLTIIFDEADQSVYSIKSVTNKIRENIIRKIIGLLDRKDRIIYISATMFAVLNSPYRTEVRPVKYLVIPNDIYNGLEFRGIFHKSNKFVFTNCLNNIQKWLKKPNYKVNYNELIEYIKDISSTTFNTQPAIALLNICHRNIDKLKLAELINTVLSNDIVVLVYTGSGIVEYSGMNKRVYNTYIGDYLQRYKDNNRNLPILIIAKKMASRSQTFRPADNSWKLTHILLGFDDKSKWEYKIQSFRGNGQYKPDDPALTIYISKRDYESIKLIMANKYLMSYRLCNSEAKPREILTNIPLMFNRYIDSDISRCDNIDYSIYRGNFKSLSEVKLFIDNISDIYKRSFNYVLVTEYHKFKLDNQQLIGKRLNNYITNKLNLTGNQVIRLYQGYNKREYINQLKYIKKYNTIVNTFLLNSDIVVIIMKYYNLLEYDIILIHDINGSIKLYFTKLRIYINVLKYNH